MTYLKGSFVLLYVAHLEGSFVLLYVTHLEGPFVLLYLIPVQTDRNRLGPILARSSGFLSRLLLEPVLLLNAGV